MSLLEGYRKNRPRVGALIGMGIAGATALASKKVPRAQALAAANFAALTVHQYEEYEDPGYFPGQFNAGVLHSKQRDRYPLNTNTALIVNVPLAYTFYALPIAFPKERVLGVAPVMFGFLQAAGQARSSRDWPATATALASWHPRSCTSRLGSRTSGRCTPRSR